MGFLDANISFKERPVGIKYTETSFTDIVPIGSGTLVLAVANHVPVNNYDEFKAYVRKNPEQFNIGFFNSYIANLFYIWAKRENLPQPKIVMYKGSTPLNQDLIGGHVPFAFDTYNTIAPFHQDKKVKVIAVLDVPGAKIYQKANPSEKITVIAQRIPEVNMSIYYGVSGPAGMSKEAVNEINRVINQGLKNPKYSKPMLDMYIGVQGGTPADLKKAHTNLKQLFRNAAKELDK
jgi:tripartite-type tricarboxylate transporter receptor subunit TctC